MANQIANFTLISSVIFFLAGDGCLQITALEAPVNLLQRHIIQIPVVTDIVPVPGMVFVGGV